MTPEQEEYFRDRLNTIEHEMNSLARILLHTIKAFFVYTAITIIMRFFS